MKTLLFWHLDECNNGPDFAVEAIYAQPNDARAKFRSQNRLDPL
jgi:hypothetical protein